MGGLIIVLGGDLFHPCVEHLLNKDLFVQVVHKLSLCPVALY